MSVQYRNNMAAFFIVAAVLILIIIFSKNLIISGLFTLLFLLSQAMITTHFAKKAEHGFYEWYSFWTIIIASFFLLIVIFYGRTIFLEAIGILISLLYIISAVVFLFSKKEEEPQEKSEYVTIDSNLSDEELNDFRKKDELEYLLDSFEIPEVKKQSHLTDYEDFKKERKNFAVEEPKNSQIKSTESTPRTFHDAPKDGYYEIKVLPAFPPEEDENQEYIELFPNDDFEKLSLQKKMDLTKINYNDNPISKSNSENNKAKTSDLKITELKEAPKLEIIRNNFLEQHKKSIDEKIKMIAEKAIEERKIELKNKKIKAVKKINSKNKVYSSITSNIFHKNKNCRLIKKTSKKNIILYSSSADAKKNGLTECKNCKGK